MRRYVIAGVVSLGFLAGCSNDHTCVDSATCADDAGSDGHVPPKDAHSDGTDGRVDAAKDARTGETGVDGTTHHDVLAPDAGDATTPDAGDARGDTFVCDGSDAPSTSDCVLTSQYGVFVAPAANGGSDTNGTGTPTQPYATLSSAIANLGSLSRIYVCNGGITDQVTVTAAVSIYGGLTCGTAAGAGGTTGPWAYATGTTAIVTSSAPGFALQVNAGSGAVDVEDMTWNAAPGTMASTSSIAGWVLDSSSVTFRRSAFVAGQGAAGQVGAQGAPGTLTSVSVDEVAVVPPSPNGQNATAMEAGHTTVCTCSTDATSQGAGGGDENDNYNGATGATAQTPPTPSTNTGAGSTEVQCAGNMGGFPGSNAVPAVGPDGLAATIGTLDAMGWHPGAGGAGTAGGAGQGGGGGGGNMSAGGNGGGGGCGGCGGAGGTGGDGGGASIGLLIDASSVQLSSTTVTAAGAGAGGKGAAGGTGKTGGFGGTPTTGACSGATGGAGAAGGLSGGGAGGISVAVLYSGTAPITDETTMLTAGTVGAPGTGGDPGKNDGAPGISRTLLSTSSL